MMKSIFLFLSMLVSALAFAPVHNFFGLDTSLDAKHVQDKAARWARAKRPKKTRPSDINRKPIVYEIDSYEKPPEFTISDEPAVPAAKPAGK